MKKNFTTISIRLKKNPFDFKIQCKIEKANPQDLGAICKLDHAVTSENRSALLEFYLNKIFLIRTDNKQISGFLIHGLETGSVIANLQLSGLDLLKFKLNAGSTKIIVPETNKLITNILTENNYQLTQRLPKMVLGKKV